jgi:hypothetical protein
MRGLPVTTLAHRASGHIALDESAQAVPLAAESAPDDDGAAPVANGDGTEGVAPTLEEATVAASVALGLGTVTTTLAAIVANDALDAEDNAAFALWLARGARIVVDEAHHVPRRQEVLRAAFGKPGPIAGALALLLLIPLALMSLAPRAGDAPGAAESVRAHTANDAAEALANLYRRSGVARDRRAPVSPEVP